jgi:hypothetical protein
MNLTVTENVLKKVDMTFFRYGDKIRVATHKFWLNCIGVEGVVVGIYGVYPRFPESMPFYRVDLSNGASIFCEFSELEKIDDSGSST